MASPLAELARRLDERAMREHHRAKLHTEPEARAYAIGRWRGRHEAAAEVRAFLEALGVVAEGPPMCRCGLPLAECACAGLRVAK